MLVRAVVAVIYVSEYFYQKFYQHYNRFKNENHNLSHKHLLYIKSQHYGLARILEAHRPPFFGSTYMLYIIAQYAPDKKHCASRNPVSQYLRHLFWQSKEKCITI